MTSLGVAALLFVPQLNAGDWTALLPSTVAQAVATGSTNCALVVVAWNGPATQPTHVAVHYYNRPAWSDEAKPVRITDDFRDLGFRLWRLLQMPAPQPVTDMDNQRLDRALRLLGEGDPTFVREQTVEPWHVTVLLPDATPYLPRSLRSRVRSVALETELGFTEWQGRLRLYTADAETAEQVGRVVAGWRELALSLADNVAEGSAAQRLRNALTQHPVRVLSNQVVAEVVVPAAPSIRVGKNAVRYALVNAVASTNGVTTTTARLDEIRRLAKQVPAAGVPSLVEALRDPSPTIRALAAWSLAPARDPQLVPVLGPLLDDEQDRVRAAVAWALGQTGTAEAWPLLAERVRKDPSELVRYRAVAGLGVLRLPSAVPAMVAALDDVAPAVREQAAINLLPLLGKGTVPPELLKMAQSPRSATRRLALILLGRTGGDGAETALRTGLVDADAIVCAEAVLGLGRRQAAIPAADVQRLLSHADEHVRGATVHALFLLGDLSVAARLRPLLQDPHPFVRAVVADSLSRGGDVTVKPPAGFSATAAFGYPF